MAVSDAPVVITGASGMIGVRLRAALRARGVPLRLISRRARDAEHAGESWFTWEDLPQAVRGAAAVVNLAGEPVVGRRWSVAVKQSILNSRVEAGAAVAAAINAASEAQRPRLLVQASAVGYYGSRGDALLDETADFGDDFLAEVCRAWESSSATVEELGVRRVRARIGIVLATEGGALAKMLPIFRFGLGGRIGDGRAWMPWIHAEDLTGMLLAILDDPRWSGAANLCGPEPLRSADFARALGRTLRRPAFLPAPAFALRLVFGEGAAPLLQSARAVPALARRLDYRFLFPTLDGALADLLTDPPATV